MRNIKCDNCGTEMDIPNADDATGYSCPECGEPFPDDREQK